MVSLVEVKKNPNIPALAPGDTVNVSVKVVEGNKERIQVFRGVVIKLRRSVDGGTFTVRRVSRGIGVERTFLFQSPLVDKVEVVQHGKVRRAKLYYLRRRSGKMARLKERRIAREEDKLEEAAAAEAAAAEAAEATEAAEVAKASEETAAVTEAAPEEAPTEEN